MDPLLISILLTFAMVVLVALELLTPSFGLLTVAALGVMCGSIFMGFQHSAAAGFAMSAVNLTVFPIAVLVIMQFIKRSPLLHQGDIQASLHPEQADSGARHLAEVGEEGEAISSLRPSGMVRFGDRRIEVVTPGKWIEPGTKVRVLRVEGSKIVVEAAE